MVLALPALAGLALSGCAGAGGGGGGGAGGGKSLNVLMVGNPQMVDIQKLTKDSFTKDTGIKVNYTVLPENELRDKVTQDVATGAGQYDLATVGAYEVPIWAGNNWLHEMGSYAQGDSSYDNRDLLRPMTLSLSGEDGKLYGLPFYGESSFLMYRKDVFQKKGLTMPDRPTWQQVAALAAKVDGAEPGMKGICLRGLPGWGEMFAPLTTVVNTFGGTWFTKDWQPEVNSPAFKQAVNFYVNLVKAHGEPGASQAGFTECLNAMSQSKVAMWYDATSAAGSLEDPSVSKVAGKVGYVHAPVEKTKSSGWLWTWAFVDAEDHQERRHRVEVRAVGHQQGLREARGPEARLVAGSRRKAGEHLRDPGVQEGGRRLRRHDPEVDRGGQPGEPGRAAAADRGRAVRGHPGVPGPRHQGVAGHRSGHRRARDRRRRSEQGPDPRPGRRQEVPEPVTGDTRPRCGVGGLVHPPRTGTTPS